MRRRATFVAVAFAILIWAPPPAAAEGFIIPWAGVNFGHDQAEGRATFGVSGGGMGAGVIGGEIDFGFAPDFFGESIDNHVLTLMANLLVGIPVGGTSGPGIRPYVTGGVGLIRTSFDNNDALSNNDVGLNVGAGVMGFFSDHVGLRGDVRYFRNFDEFDLSELDLLGTFDFWRASVGLVIR